MSDLNIYPCGGFGLNIMDLFKTQLAKTEVGMDCNVFGIDLSSNNLPKSKSFEVVHLEHGTGKMRSIAAGSDYAEFVESFMSSHKPNKFNIVVFSASGGSGSMLGPEIVRYILERKLPVVAVILDDFTSDVEEKNCAQTYMTLDNYRRKTNRDLIYYDISNGSRDGEVYRTRAEVNREVCDVLNLLTVMLDDGHMEMDYNDISNFLNFSSVTKNNAIMSKLIFMDQDTVQEYNGATPVSALSLFKDGDSICNMWHGVQYRSTGIFHQMELPTNMTQFHAVLDYGEAVQEILGKIQNYKDREAQTSMKMVKSFDIGDGTDGPIF